MLLIIYTARREIDACIYASTWPKKKKKVNFLFYYKRHSIFVNGSTTNRYSRAHRVHCAFFFFFFFFFWNLQRLLKKSISAFPPPPFSVYTDWRGCNDVHDLLSSRYVYYEGEKLLSALEFVVVVGAKE